MSTSPLVGGRLPHHLGPLDDQLRWPVLLRAYLPDPHARRVVEPTVTLVLAQVGGTRHYPIARRITPIERLIGTGVSIAVLCPLPACRRASLFYATSRTVLAFDSINLPRTDACIPSRSASSGSPASLCTSGARRASRLAGWLVARTLWLARGRKLRGPRGGRRT
jgi:hypothetical protein